MTISEMPGPLPVKVLILIPSLAVGGAEMDVVRILPEIDSAQFLVTVCTLIERGELAALLEAQGIQVVGPFSFKLGPVRRLFRLTDRWVASVFEWVKPGSGSGRVLGTLRRAGLLLVGLLNAPYSLLRWLIYLLQVIQLARPVARYIRSSNVDIIHTILPNSYLVGAYANLLAGRKPLVMSRLSLNAYHRDERQIAFIERKFLHRSVDAAIGNSNAVLEELRLEGVEPSKLRLVYNGIDAGAFNDEMMDRSAARHLLAIPENALVFSVVANFYTYKGHDDLLMALQSIAGLLPPDWMCLMVGRDELGRLSELQRWCQHCGLSRQVRFLGARRDVPKILSASDIHVSASHQEGFPNNILEAMCAGLPVVATAVGGVPEMVVDGETGILVPPHNPQRMANALLDLAKNPERRAVLGQAGRARVISQFSIQRNVAALEATYRLLAGRVRT